MRAGGRAARQAPCPGAGALHSMQRAEASEGQRIEQLGAEVRALEARLAQSEKAAAAEAAARVEAEQAVAKVQQVAAAEAAARAEAEQAAEYEREKRRQETEAAEIREFILRKALQMAREKREAMEEEHAERFAFIKAGMTVAQQRIHQMETEYEDFVRNRRGGYLPILKMERPSEKQKLLWRDEALSQAVLNKRYMEVPSILLDAMHRVWDARKSIVGFHNAQFWALGLDPEVNPWAPDLHEWAARLTEIAYSRWEWEQRGRR